MHRIRRLINDMPSLNLNYILQNKKISFFFYIALIFLVIFLHGAIRISQIPQSFPWIGKYFWEPSINLATGKGFTQDSGYTTSPELSTFMDSFYGNEFPKVYEDRKMLSFSDSITKFTDYEVKDQTITFRDSLGYRYLVGLIWKNFGFNWYYVGLLNYLFSLGAMLALMVCSYRVVGPSSALFVGLAYSILLPEPFYITSFGRDGIPLWFAAYLTSALGLLFHKPLNLKRILSYSVLMGTLIFCAIQGRNSSFFFLPITIFIYFILIFFSKTFNLSFKLSQFFKKYFYQKISYFFLASLVTCFTFLAMQNLFYRSLPPLITPNEGHMHAFVLGLAMLNGNHPSQIRYSDSIAVYQGVEYAKRHFNWDDVDSLEKKYETSLGNYYIDFIKTYPQYWGFTVFFKSITQTLLTLGKPCDKSYLQSEYLSSYCNNYLFYTALIGVILLFRRKRTQFLVIILMTFMLSNAMMSFIQFNPRHSVMGYSSYYFLIGVAVSYLFYSLRLLTPTYIKELLKHIQTQKQEFIKLAWKKKVIKFQSYIIILFISGASLLSYNLLYIYLGTIEERNITQLVNYFRSLPKKQLTLDLTADPLMVPLPPETEGKTVGIYCMMGKVHTPEKIDISIPGIGYNSEIISKVGNNVVIFIPLFNPNKSSLYSLGGNKVNLKISHSGNCKTFYWSDLSLLKGPLWEGSYEDPSPDGSVANLELR